MSTCSVIILNWNGAQMLRRFLPSVVRSLTHHQSPITNHPSPITNHQSPITNHPSPITNHQSPITNHPCSLIVADNGSTDDSLTVLANEFPGVQTIVLDRNYGFAEGYNRAIDRIDSDYVVLLNSDVETPDGWLEPLLAYMDANTDVAAVQPKIRSCQRPDFFEHAGAAGGYLNALGYPYCRGRVLWRVEQDKGQYDDIVDVDWTSGACMCVRTKVYKELGGLDARFFAHMEEIDLCWRMRNAGWRLACVPQSMVYHLGGGSLSYDNPRKNYLNHRNNLLMIRKNKKHPFGVLFVRFFLDYAAAFFYLLQGRPKSFLAVFSARRDYHRMIANG